MNVKILLRVVALLLLSTTPLANTNKPQSSECPYEVNITRDYSEYFDGVKMFPWRSTELGGGVFAFGFRELPESSNLRKLGVLPKDLVVKICGVDPSEFALKLPTICCSSSGENSLSMIFLRNGEHEYEVELSKTR